MAAATFNRLSFIQGAVAGTGVSTLLSGLAGKRAQQDPYPHGGSCGDDPGWELGR